MPWTRAPEASFMVDASSRLSLPAAQKPLFIVAMVRVDIRYQGSLRCEAIHGPSQNLLLTDAPVDNHGKGEAFSPTDLVATALGTCMLTIMGIVAEREQIDLRGTTVSVTKEMRTDGVRRIGRLTTEFDLSIPRSSDPKGVLERAAMTCPVHHSLHPEVEKPVIFRWKGE